MEIFVGVVGLWGIQIEYENMLCELLVEDFDMSLEGVGVLRFVVGMLVLGNFVVIRWFFIEDIDLLCELIEVVDQIEELFKYLMVKCF